MRDTAADSCDVVTPRERRRAEETKMSQKIPLSPETIAAQGLGQIDEATAGVVPAIHPSTTYLRDEDYRLLVPDNSYARDENPSFTAAENVLRHLETAADALLFSSGMAAATAVMQTLKPGDHVVAPAVMYWGLRNWMTGFCEQYGIGLSLFDAGIAGSLEESIEPGRTKIVWVETPCNPTWDVIDIAAAASAAHDAGARLVVDSTVATPVLTRPIEHGADIVMHSATKFLGGHCDLVAGTLACAKQDSTWETIRHARVHAGAIPGVLEAWLLQRSLRTLFLRVRKSSDSALAIARHFEHHPALSSVLYPGLPSHPRHEVATRQMDGGFGGMLSIRLAGGATKALETAGRCQVFARATSLGGVESLVEHRRTIEGDDSPVPDDLLRLSVGIEAVEDLVTDLEQAQVK